MIHIGKDNHENHGTGLCFEYHGHAHAHMSIDIIEQQNERFRQECADVRELMAGLRAIHTFYEKNEGMITGN